MQACDNMLSTNFLGASAGNGPNAAMYGQNAQYAPFPGPGLPYGLPQGLPPSPNVQTATTQAGITALNHSINGLSIQDGASAGPGTIPNSQLSLMPGHGGIQEPYFFLIRDGIVYARADIAPFACLQGQGNVPGIPGRLMARNGQPHGPVGFMGNVTYVPVAPHPPPFVPQGDGAGREPPAFNENQISVGSHSDDPSSPETPNTVVGNQFGPNITIASGDVASAVPYYHGTPSPRHYLNGFEPAHLAKTYGIQKLATDLFTVAGTNPAIPRAVPAVLGARKTLHECFDNPTGTTNVYIRGLHPETTDDMLHAYAARFGHVANSKAMIDSQTGACKGYVFIRTRHLLLTTRICLTGLRYGFACFQTIQEAQSCIRGFYYLGYEVSFARVSQGPLNHLIVHFSSRWVGVLQCSSEEFLGSNIDQSLRFQSAEEHDRGCRSIFLIWKSIDLSGVSHRNWRLSLSSIRYCQAASSVMPNKTVKALDLHGEYQAS